MDILYSFRNAFSKYDISLLKSEYESIIAICHFDVFENMPTT